MKPLCVIQSPFATRSGYGDAARDLVRHIIELDRYDVILVSMPWGHCPMNALVPGKDDALISRIASQPVQLPRQPELFIQVSVPSEFQAIGKYNIGVTAGIETTMCSVPWLEGCNRMDLVVNMSNHGKTVFASTTAEQRDQSGQVVRQIRVEKPQEVLPNCVDLSVFRALKVEELAPSITSTLATVREKFCYLFVGHWIKGGYGEDRKNIGVLINTFCEAFKETPSDKRPALIVKTSGAGFSLMDQEECLSKIGAIREAHGVNCPNIYLLHGDLSEQEMASLYSHPKVKVHVSFTKGEGFGRPLLEATMSKKPVIASGWSGHLDFLNAKDALLVDGELRPVEHGAVWDQVIIPESSWYNVKPDVAIMALKHAFKNYDRCLPGAEALYKANREKFGYDAVRAQTAALLDKYVPSFTVVEPPKLKLPTLNKVKMPAVTDGL